VRARDVSSRELVELQLDRIERLDRDPGRHGARGRRRRAALRGRRGRRPYLDQLVWNTVVGMARLPSTALPAGRTARGLPVALQLVGPFLGDLTTLRFAELAAEALGVPERPPGFA
jgi:Asp-tRNA(Asn)/Glu-tRNA(Gln) amidotransferase A subunit family amidase